MALGTLIPCALLSIAVYVPLACRFAGISVFRFVGITLGGALEGDALQARLERAAYLVLPACNGEPLPRALIDAFANGLAVIAPEEGAAAELVEPGRNGLLFTPGSARELARRVAWAEAFPERIRQMGECARADYLARFIADWGYQKLYGERRRYARV